MFLPRFRRSAAEQNLSFDTIHFGEPVAGSGAFGLGKVLLEDCSCFFDQAMLQQGGRETQTQQRKSKTHLDGFCFRNGFPDEYPAGVSLAEPRHRPAISEL